MNPRQAATPGDFSNMSGGYGNLGGESHARRCGTGAERRLSQQERTLGIHCCHAVSQHTYQHPVNVRSLTPRVKIPFAIGGVNNTLVSGRRLGQLELQFDHRGRSHPGHRTLRQSGVDAAQYRLVFPEHHALVARAPCCRSAVACKARIMASSDQIGGAAGYREREPARIRNRLAPPRHRADWRSTASSATASACRTSTTIYNLFTATVTMLEPQTSHDREIGTELKARVARVTGSLSTIWTSTTKSTLPDPITFASTTSTCRRPAATAPSCRANGR